jgi:uncharacterized iron-regulated membrane protein
MKLSRHAFVRFWGLHAWAGVVGALLLYLMCACGALTLFREQLARWEEPLSQVSVAAPISLEQSLSSGLDAVGDVAAEVWLEPSKHPGGAAKLTFQRRGSARWESAWVEPERGEVVPERERLSGFIYRLHFLWHEVTGFWLYYLAGLLSVVLLVGLVSGVLLHFKNLSGQLHQFRPQRESRVWWSDLHKVLGVMGLPFQLMYAYTGAFLVLAPVLLRAFVGPVFNGDTARAQRLATGMHDAPPARAGAPIPVLSADSLLARARRAMPALQIEAIEIEHHAHEAGTFAVWGHDRGTPETHAQITLRERDGVELSRSSASPSPSAGLRRWAQGLHLGLFGGLWLRWLYFALGATLCLTLLSGNLIFLARRARSAHAGTRALERLTLGTASGVLLALAALFFASRALPLHVANRGALEEAAFFGALVVCLLWAARARDARRAFSRQLGVAGVLLASTPLLAARVSKAGLLGAGPPIGAVVAVDVALEAAALTLLAVAWSLRRALPEAAESDGTTPDASRPSRWSRV